MARIWIINQYASTPETGIGGRHHYLAQSLSQKGHDVSIIAAQWHHLLRKDSENIQGVTRAGYRFVCIPVLRYLHAHDKRRALNWFLFSYQLRRLEKRLEHKPDVILYSSPALPAFKGAQRLAQRTGARLVFEVRDIWPLTLTEVGNKNQNHPLLRWMQRVEDHAYRVSDAVISNLPYAVDHMASRGMDRKKFTWIPNGVYLPEVSSPAPLTSSFLENLPKDKFIVGYAGTVGAANSLETLLGAAEILKARSDIVFAIVGGGRDLEALVSKAREKSLNNVVFLGSVEKRQVQSALQLFDACVLCWHQSPLYRFGTAANKIPEYLYSGKPVLNAFSGKGDLATAYEAGFCVNAEDPSALAQAIVRLKELPETERILMGQKGREAVIKHHNYDVLADQLERVLLLE